MQGFLIRPWLAATVILAATPALTPGSAWAQAPAQNPGDSAGGASVLTPPMSGQAVYRQVCQACHMANAKGGTGAAVIPGLADNPRLAVAAYPIAMVVNGRGAMPGFTDLLAPAQIAGVVGYIRTNFGNHYEKPVTPAEVAAIVGRAR